MKSVAAIQMKRVAAMLESKRIGLDMPDEVLVWLGREGFDPQMGARPLKRLVQSSIVNPLSRMLLDGRLRPGEIARLRVEGDELRVEAEALQ
jgi:ATP-dependent Clp protease ATP-binding subunit ClpA